MILSEEKLKLSEDQKKLIGSGWGKKVIDDVTVKKIVYDSSGVEVSGYLAYPKNTPLKYPLIIWNRGGNFNDGRIDEFLAQGMFGEIASWGYVVLASNYRDKDEFGGADVNDVLNLIPLANEISFCDTSRIGMEGWSRGGMMTYLVLSKTDKIKCAVVISGLADLFRSMESRSDLSKVYEKIFGGTTDDEFTDNMKKRSAVYFADKINKRTNTLLIHGTDDRNISYQDSVDMYEKLKSNGINCELKLFEGGDHYLKKERKEVAKLRREWFEKYL